MQRKQRHFDDEDLKPQNHVTAKVILHMRRRLSWLGILLLAAAAATATASAAGRSGDAFIRALGACETRVLSTSSRGGVADYLGRSVCIVTVIGPCSETTETDASILLGRMLLFGTGVIGMKINAWGMAATEASFDFCIIDAELSEYANDVGSDVR